MPEEKIRAKDLLNRLLDQHYEEAWEAKRQGRPVGWVSSNFPQEFLETMGLTVCYPENHSTSLSAKHESLDMIHEAERLGYHNDLCGYAQESWSTWVFSARGTARACGCLCPTMWYAATTSATSW